MHVSYFYEPLQLQRINDYEILGELGHGSFGVVYLIHNAAGEKFAMKTFPNISKPKSLNRGGPPALSESEVIRREIAIMKRFSHPNLVNLVEVSDYVEVDGEARLMICLSRDDICVWALDLDCYTCLIMGRGHDVSV